MLIGILADIHDAVGPLRAALTALRQRGVEQVVTLGDAFDSYRRGDPEIEVASLLHEAGAIGVWGNHDAGLSHEVSVQVRDVADPTLLAFAAHLQPQLTLEGCRFSHIEPWRNPCRVEDLWAFDGVPDTDIQAERSFEAVSERVLFLGHFHAWLAMKRSVGRMPWDGLHPITLRGPERYLVVIAPVADGWCATFDTEQFELTPICTSV
jgi:predicted phosphodiesterase